jgi:hypothetical protein
MAAITEEGNIKSFDDILMRLFAYGYGGCFINFKTKLNFLLSVEDDHSRSNMKFALNWERYTNKKHG